MLLIVALVPILIILLILVLILVSRIRLLLIVIWVSLLLSLVSSVILRLERLARYETVRAGRERGSSGGEGGRLSVHIKLLRLLSKTLLLVFPRVGHCVELFVVGRGRKFEEVGRTRRSMARKVSWLEEEEAVRMTVAVDTVEKW